MFLFKYNSDEMQFLAKEISKVKIRVADQGFPWPCRAIRLIMHPVTKYKMGSNKNNTIGTRNMSAFYGIRILLDEELPIDEIQILINAEGLLL